MTESAPLPAPPTPRHFPAAIFMAVVLFALTLFLDTRHNTFPFTYHPDEGGKVVQVMRGERNYHHPLLLLSTTAIVSKVAFVPHDPQAIVQTGRRVSAGFVAGSVAVLALVAWWNYGLLIGWGAGLALAFQEDLFELAHYMKEDPALLFGLALALLAAHVWWWRPGKKSLRFLAIACGLATAGKYLGIVTLLFALPLVIWHRAADAFLPRATRVRTFLMIFVAAFLLANVPIFALKLSNPFRSIGNEVHGVAGGHQGLTRKVPHAEYLIALKHKVPPLAIALVAVYAIASLVKARRRTPPEWIVLLFPILFLAMISCSPKIAERYLLPVSAMIPLLAALGVGEIGELIGGTESRGRQVVGGLVAALILTFLVRSELPTFGQLLAAIREQTPDANQAALFTRAYIGFQHDDPTAVAAWIMKNLPQDAIIAEDHRVNLSASKADGLSTNARVPQKVMDASFAPELGTLDELRAKGVGYVAVCRQNYGRYFNDDMKPQAGVKTRFDKQRDFYAQVFQEGKLLKEWPKGPISYLQPGIRLYSIAPKDAVEKAESTTPAP